MTRTFSFRFVPAVLAIAVGLCPGQNKKEPLPLSAEDVGTRVVAAIRNGDVVPLEAFVAGKGVSLGPEEPKMTAAAFIAQLQQKRGIYCVLMDSRCLLAARKGAPDTSLRARTLRQPIAALYSPLGNFPESMEVKVVVQANPGTVLFSVFVQRTHEGWRLVRIEYV